MGILGEMLKKAAVMGVAAIPVAGPFLAPVAAAALAGPGIKNKIGAAAGQVAGSLGGEETPSPEAASIKPDAIAGRVADNVEASFDPASIQNSPLGMMAFDDVLKNGAQEGGGSFGSMLQLNLGKPEDPRKGLFAGTFNNGGGF